MGSSKFVFVKSLLLIFEFVYFSFYFLLFSFFDFRLYCFSGFFVVTFP